MHLLQWSSFGLKATAKRVNANVWDNPFPDSLEALWSRANASQLFLHPPEEEVVHWSHIWQKGGRVLELLDLVGTICVRMMAEVGTEA